MISGLIARARSIWKGVRRPSDVDAEMKEEFRAHLALRTDDLVRRGLSPEEAARTARVEFGSLDHYVDRGRDSRDLRPFDDLRLSWLDLKLGVRMLVRYPGLTLVGGIAMAFAVWVGAGVFEMAKQLMSPTLPLAEGERVVGLRTWDASKNTEDPRNAHDFLRWRTELRTVEDLSASRQIEKSLITADGANLPVAGAEMSASAFRVTRVAPLAGRTLSVADEQLGAAPVAVIGYDLWQRRFNGDRGIVGQEVQLGDERVTIVGIMPAGFAFPYANELWMPLRLDAAPTPRSGPAITVFGRLAPEATLADAEAELTTLGQRAAAVFPETHQHLRPQVMPYAKSILDVSGWYALAAASSNLPALFLLTLICCNVALLVFARTAAREREIAVRTALGASRRRIVMQLFGEALVLGSISTVVGLMAVDPGLRWVMTVVEGELLQGNKLPFWIAPRLSAVTVLYAALLTLLGAVIAGVVPALRVTRGIGERLKQSAGAGGMRFGGIWTAIIVAQIAVTVAFPFVTWTVRQDALTIRNVKVGFADEEFLTFRLEMDRERSGNAPVATDTSRAVFMARYATKYAELEQRLQSDGAVAGVTFADRLPRMYHPHRLVRLDEGGGAPLHPSSPDGYRVSSARVAPSFFDVVRAPTLAGRAFHSGDYVPDSAGGPVIVNESFIRLVLGNRNPIGRRFKYIQFEERSPRRVADIDKAPWYEIVGVVRDMGMAMGNDAKVAGIYHPAATGSVYPASIALHVKGDPAAFGPKLQAIAAATDPSLRLNDVRPMNRLNDAELEFFEFWFRMLIGVSVVAFGLSLAGIYAVMAFTVARRTREIGVRVALGASARSVLVTIFRRPLIQVASGVVAGAMLLLGIAAMASEGMPKLQFVFAILVCASLTFLVCLTACIVPTRRALRVQPTVALRAED